jgi:Ulp1 protease family, C-terminal catalytic domain
MSDHNQISDSVRPPELPGQLLGTVEDGDDLYATAVYSRGVRINLLDLKGLEAVYGDGEVAAIERLKYSSDHFKPSMLPDTIIDAWLYALVLDHPHITVESCGRVASWIRNGVAETDRRGRMKFGTEEILLPLNAYGNHWTLLVYSVQKNSFLHLDSLYSASISDQFFENLKAGVAAEYGVPCNESAIEKVKCSQQPAGNDFDSGVFIIHFTDCCAKGLAYTTRCDTVKVRRTVFEKIMEHSI